MDWRLQWVVVVVLVAGICTAQDNSSSSVQHRAALASSVNDFGLRLLLQLEGRGEGNAVLGAASLAGVLGMAMMGGVGSTYEELAHALGFPQDILSSGANHAALGSMLRGLAGGAGLAQAAAAARGAGVRPAYRALLQRFYNADVLDADFDESQKTLEIINSWVSAHTSGLVPRLVARPLPAHTRLVLLSAHHFRASWESPFMPEYTRPMEFKTRNGTVMADLMLTMGRFDYVFSEEHHCHMVALPYRGGAATLYALMPLPARYSLAEVLDKLDWSTIDQMRANMTNQSVVLRFPKMRLSADEDLRAALQALGVAAMFQPARANFALALAAPGEPAPLNTTADEELLQRAAGGRWAAGEGAELRARLRRLEARPPKVHVDAVLHQAHINFDEHGTEAAAASGGVMARSARRFVADAPFLLFIRDAGSGLVTFSAVVSDPSEGAATDDHNKNNTTDS